MIDNCLELMDDLGRAREIQGIHGVPAALQAVPSVRRSLV